MKILIIGHQGFIGSHCVSYFAKDNEVITPQKTTDFGSLFQNQNFDVCINASGSAHVGFSFENPATDFELNVANVQKMLSAIHLYNPTCKFINFSSAAVYGNPMTFPINENSGTKPLSPYGFHKLQSEYLLCEYHKFFGLKTCNLRVFSAYGQGLKKQLFWDLYQKYLKNSQDIEIFGTGNESRDFIFIDDLVQCVDLIIQNATFEGDIFNIASGKESSIMEAVDIFFKNLDPKARYYFSGKTKIGDPNNWCADIQKMKNLGFLPKFALSEGLFLHTKWLKNLK